MPGKDQPGLDLASRPFPLFVAVTSNDTSDETEQVQKSLFFANISPWMHLPAHGCFAIEARSGLLARGHHRAGRRCGKLCTRRGDRLPRLGSRRGLPCRGSRLPGLSRYRELSSRRRPRQSFVHSTTQRRRGGVGRGNGVWLGQGRYDAVVTRWVCNNGINSKWKAEAKEHENLQICACEHVCI